MNLPKKANQIEHLVFTDIETTAKDGPAFRTDQIVEVAAVKVRLAVRKVVDVFTTLIRPKENGPQTQIVPSRDGQSWDTVWDLGEYHTKAGHFQDVDWSQGLTLDYSLRYLGDQFFPGATFAGNNVPFDLDHYQRDFKALGLPWPKTDYHRVDLASPAMFLVMGGILEGMSLRYSAAWAGRPPQKHRALSDCYDGIAVFWAMFDHFIGPKPMGAPPPPEMSADGRFYLVGQDWIPFKKGEGAGQ